MSLAGPPAGKSTASDKTPQQSTQRTHHRQVSVYCDMLCVLIQSVATVQCESVMLCLHRHSLSIKELWTCKLLNVFYMLRSFNNVKLILIFGSRGNICDPAFSNTMKLWRTEQLMPPYHTLGHTWLLMFCFPSFRSVFRQMQWKLIFLLLVQNSSRTRRCSVNRWCRIKESLVKHRQLMWKHRRVNVTPRHGWWQHLYGPLLTCRGRGKLMLKVCKIYSAANLWYYFSLYRWHLP